MKKKLLILGVFILLALPIYFAINNLNYKSSENIAVVSYPQSVEINSEQSEEDTNFSIDYSLYNKSSRNTLYQDCGGASKPIVPVDIEYYNYIEPLSFTTSLSRDRSYSLKVFKNMAKYLDNDQIIRESFDSLQDILFNNAVLNRDVLHKAEMGFGIFCTGPASVPPIKIMDIEIKGESKAKAVITFGSTQSTINSNWIPVFITIISTNNTDYIWRDIHYELSELVFKIVLLIVKSYLNMDINIFQILLRKE